MSTKILVVDDETDLQSIITQKFKRKINSKDYEFSFARNGIEALNQICQDDSIDLILTDINMPQMDGLTLLSKIATLDRPLLRSVVVSAYGDMHNIRTAMNRGAFDFVVKPIDLEDLEITINKCVQNQLALKEAFQIRKQMFAIQNELDIAQTIQTSLLPKTFPPFPNRKEFDIFANMVAAKQVGGDFYDFFLIDDQHLAFAIGDVSGKGVPAALFMAVSKTLLKSTALKGLPPDECLQLVNRILYLESASSMFVTIFYGILDSDSGRVNYSNGGHNPPYVMRRDGRIDPLENTKGLLLGAVEHAAFNCKDIVLEHGESLILYTDGITEAINQAEELYGDERLQVYLKYRLDENPEQIINGVMSDVNAYAFGLPQMDDCTMLVLRYV